MSLTSVAPGRAPHHAHRPHHTRQSHHACRHCPLPAWQPTASLWFARGFLLPTRALLPRQRPLRYPCSWTTPFPLPPFLFPVIFHSSAPLLFLPPRAMVASAKRCRAVNATSRPRPARGVSECLPLPSSGCRPPPPPPLSIRLTNVTVRDYGSAAGCECSSLRPWPASPPSPRARALAKENRRLRAAAMALSRRIAAAERVLAAQERRKETWPGRTTA